MAGGLTGKKDPKNHKLNNSFSSEVLKEDSHIDNSSKQPIKFSLNGILGLNQTIEINKPAPKAPESLIGLSHLHQEQTILFDQHQKELQRAIDELRIEIKKLAGATDNLSTDVIRIADTPVTETNQYQISVLSRIKNFIMDMHKNISEAGLWVEAFASKKKKKNAFWNKAKDKKKGGDQYLFSNEHSAARSVN